MRWIFVFLIGGFGSFAQARVFDINTEKFAAYLGGSYGPTSIGKAAFENASANGETYDSGLATIYSGEFGFIYSSRYLNVRFGIEVIRPPTTGVIATNAAGTTLYNLNSDMTVITPKIGFEFNLKQWKESRVFANVNYGSANLGLNNNYIFPAGGPLSPKTDYTEEGRSTAALIEGSLGWEILMFDTTTLVLSAGYRQLNFAKLTHNRDVSTLQGDKVKGDAMLNVDGTERAINMTGYFAGLAFRFWVF